MSLRSRTADASGIDDAQAIAGCSRNPLHVPLQHARAEVTQPCRPITQPPKMAQAPRMDSHRPLSPQGIVALVSDHAGAVLGEHQFVLAGVRVKTLRATSSRHTATGLRAVALPVFHPQLVTYGVVVRQAFSQASFALTPMPL